MRGFQISACFGCEGFAKIQWIKQNPWGACGSMESMDDGFPKAGPKGPLRIQKTNQENHENQSKEDLG